MFTDYAAQFRDAIAAAGLTPPDEVIADGRLRRFASNGKRKDLAGWYVMHDGDIPAGAFGDWRSGVDETWHANIGRPWTDAEKAAHRAKVAEAARLREAEEARVRAEAAKRATAIWDGAKPAPDSHPYLQTKAVRAHGLRVHDDGRLIVPLRDTDGALHSVQLIAGDGSKRFLPGGRVAGCFHVLGELDGTGTLCFGEGFATDATIHEATGCAVVVCFNAGNLLQVAQALRAKYPERPMAIGADDDWRTEGNPGLTKATEAARAVGARLAVPDFGAERQPGDTDFNDMARLHGIEAVRLAIEEAREPDAKQAEEPTEEPSEKDRTGFHVLEDWTEGAGGRKLPPGVWYFDPSKADGPAQTWVCSPLHVDAVTFDSQDSNFGRLLRFRNSLKRWREWSMPMELLAGDGSDLRRELLAMGVEISPNSKARSLLATYLQGEHPKRRIRCALQVGWHGGSFVLPDAVYGADAGAVVFQSGERGHEEFTRGGTLDGWRDGVAALAAGNAVLMLAVSAAFAGPLLGRCNGESGGLHLNGDSSTGKTSALEAACSVWGGVNFKRSWRATANGMEGAASLFNDCLLALDEISEADPREIGAIVYALGNGRGKQRMSRTCAARGVTRWRCMVLSSGEQSISTAMQAGGFRAKAGQSVRLLDLPAAGKHGAWDELHGHPSGAAFSDALKRAAAAHYGHAGRAFLGRLTQDARDFSALLEQAKAAKLFGDTGEGQHKRAAARFALIGMAGEVAAEYGLTGWKEGQALAAAAEGFRLWCAQRGRGNDERRQILEQVSGFIERHGDARFSAVDADSERHPVRDRAGWWRNADDGREYLFTADGMREALKGFDFKRALDVLQAAGALPAPGADGKNSKLDRIDGRRVRVYAIKCEALEC